MSGGSKGGPGDRDPTGGVDWLPHEAVLVVDSEALQAKSDLIPTKVHAIVDLCDGTRTAQQVVATSALTEQRTNKILERLLEDQIVIVGSIGPPPEPVRSSPLVGTASGVLEPSPEPAPRVERARITAEVPALLREPRPADVEVAVQRNSPRLVYLGLAVVGLFGGAWLIQDLRGSEELKDGKQRAQQPRSAADAAAHAARALTSKPALPSKPAAKPAAAPALDAAVPAPPKGPGYATLLTQAEEVLRAPQRWEEMSKYQQRRMRKLLQQAVAVNPKGWQALQELALIELKHGDLKRATQLARQAMKVYPDAPYAHLVLGASLQERGSSEEARRSYLRFLELCPRCRYSVEIRHIAGQL